MLGNRQRYYIKGKIEGFLNVRLEKILEQDQGVREAYIKGYAEGSLKRRSQTPEEMEENTASRDGYIRSIAYKVALEDYPADSSSLNEVDKKVFEEGFNAGLLDRQVNEVMPLELRGNARVRK